MDYQTQLMREALAVGGMNAAAVLFVQATLPLPPRYAFVQWAIAGALIHLGCEASGLNLWYLSNGAAYRKSVSDGLDELSNAEEELGWATQAMQSSQLSCLLDYGSCGPPT